MPVITCIEDLRQLAQKRVPRMFYDYADCGSWTEGTYRANQRDFDAIRLRQRVALDVEKRNLATTMAAPRVATPLAPAPPGVLPSTPPAGPVPVPRAPPPTRPPL